MWKALFQKIIYELGIDIENPFFEMTLIVVWKRALQLYVLNLDSNAYLPQPGVSSLGNNVD